MRRCEGAGGWWRATAACPLPATSAGASRGGSALLSSASCTLGSAGKGRVPRGAVPLAQEAPSSSHPCDALSPHSRCICSAVLCRAGGRVSGARLRH